MNLGVVILAAGQGTRMRSALPKVLHLLAGKPILKHVLDTTAMLNPQTIVVVHGHGGDQVLARFPDSSIQWVEQQQQLGTGHAVLQAMPQLQTADKILVLYGDVPLITTDTLKNLLANTVNSHLGIITAHLADPSGYGRIVRDSTGQILRIVEQKDATPQELAIAEVNTGIVVAERQSLATWLERIDKNNAQGEFYLTDCIGLAVADGNIVVSVQPQGTEEILGINNRSQLAYLERHVQLTTAQQLMLAGVTLADPARFDLRGTLQTGTDVSIDINVIISGTVVLETGVMIGPNCLLHNCHIGAGTCVYANSIIEDAVVGANARIGPFARIRPGTELAAQVHIGNFVELKNAKIGNGSKANHLSYLGDCEIGSNVNIGAGTITCNYDGANKHHTVIGADAFIGSNTALVAPVTVGERATVGAGSVISKDVPAEKLTLTRSSQRTIDGWRRPAKTLKQ